MYKQMFKSVKKSLKSRLLALAANESVFRVILVRIFPHFGMDVERYGVSLCTQFECGKMRTRITPNTDTFYAVTAIIATKITLLIVLSVIPCSFGT